MAGFADSSRGGPRVTLRLADRADLDKFIGAEGKRFAVVMVELNDDDTLAEEPAPARPAVQRERMAPLCEWAVMRCGEPMFQRWAAGHPDAPKYRKDTPVETAKAAVLFLCGIESRKYLDTSAVAASKLHVMVRKPYAHWLSLQNEVPA